MPLPARFNVFLSWGTSALAHAAVGGAMVGFGGTSVFWVSGSNSPQGNAFDSPALLAGAAVSADQPPVTISVVRAVAVPLPKALKQPDISTEHMPEDTSLDRQPVEITLARPSPDSGKLVEHLAIENFVSAEVAEIVISRKAQPSDEPQIDHDDEPAAAPKQGQRELAEPALGDHGSGPNDVDSLPSVAGAAEPPSPFASNPLPGYPTAAFSERRQGSVAVLMVVSPQGEVVKATVKKSSGSPDIDAVALATAKTWKFKPARRDGVPVTHEFTKSFKFRIEN